MNRDEQEMRLSELEKLADGCRNCPLASTRTHVVFGAGVASSRLLFVGEGPGENEDLQGEPFVGRGGQLLDKMLLAVHLNRRKNVYLTNMVKCRPPGNRDPKPEEQQACAPFLAQQLELIAPKIIVCLGRIAACHMIGAHFKVTKDHGKWIQKEGVWMMGMFHPAALLRNPVNKPSAFEDFLILRDKVREVLPELLQDVVEEPPVP